MESSRRDLLNDMAEQGLSWKNILNTYYPYFKFSITPKTGIALPKTDVLTERDYLKQGLVAEK